MWVLQKHWWDPASNGRYPQAWKKIKEETDECMADLDKITDKVPIQLNKCEGLVGSVASVKDIE